MTIDETPLSDEALVALRAGRKIDAIRLLREQRNLDLRDAKRVVETYLAEQPSNAAQAPLQASSGIGRLVTIGLLAALGYAVYRWLT